MNADKTGVSQSAFIGGQYCFGLFHCLGNWSAAMEEAETAFYWIVTGGKNFKMGQPVASKRFGPFASQEEAERAKPDLLPWDTDEHVYWIHIEAEPREQRGAAAREANK